MHAVKSLAAVIAMLSLVLVGSPAVAETVVDKDSVDDAPAWIDITRARYTYNSDRAKVIARIPDLGRAGEAALSITRFEVFEAGYVVRIIKRRGERATVGLYFFDHFDLNKRKCDGVSGTWGDSYVRLSVPTDCLDGHAKRNVFAQFGIQRGQKVDRAPAVRRLARD